MVENNGSKVDEIREELRGNTGERSHAVELLDALDEYSPSLVDKFAEPLVGALEEEKNAYVVMQGWSVLAQMARSHPQGVEPHIDIVLEEMIRTAEDLDEEDDFEDDHVLSKGTDIVESVASATTMHLDFPVSKLAALSNVHGTDSEFRSSIYLLMGQIATDEAIDQLLKAYDWEVGTARDAIESALDHACTLVIESLTGDGDLPQQEAIKVIQRLYHSDEALIPVTDNQLRESWPDLIDEVAPGTAVDIANLLLLFAEDSPRMRDEITQEFVRKQSEAATIERGEVIASFATEHPTILDEIVELMPEPSAAEQIDDWPAGIEMADRRFITGLSEPETASIAEVALIHRLRETGSPAVPPVLLEYLDTDAGDRLPGIFEVVGMASIPNKESFKDHENVLYHALDSEDDDVQETVISLAESILGWGPGIADVVLSVAVDRIASEAEDSDSWWTVLEIGSRRAPSVLLSDLVRVDWDFDSMANWKVRKLLDLIEESGGRTSTVPSKLARQVLPLLQAEMTMTVLAAVDAVAEMGFYPPPESLVDLRDTSSSRVRAAVDRAIDQLERSHRQVPFRRGMQGEKDTSLSLFSGESGDLHLKRYAGDGRWTDIDIGPLRRRIIETTTQRVERGENVPLVYPYFHPQDIVLLVVAVALEKAPDNPVIALYSPGSRSHWGMKGEIREELENFGLADEEGDVVSATPIPDIVPHAYIYDGEVRSDSNGEGPGEIILTKNLEELEIVPRLDLVVSNLISRTSEDFGLQLAEIEEEHPDAGFVNAYSYYVRNETEGRPRYGPPEGLEATQTVPGADIIDDSLIGAGAGVREAGENLGDVGRSGSSEETQSLVADVRNLTEPKTIRIEKVDAPRIEKLLDGVFEESAKLRGVEDQGAGSLIFSRQLFFERLPVTGREYEEWVRERLFAGERFVPPLIQERLEDISRKADSVENLQAVQILDNSKSLLDRLADELETANPLSGRLEELILSAKEEGERIAVLSESPKHAQILRTVLLDRGVVDENDLDGAPVSIVAPNDARSIGHHSLMVVCGALHAENAGFYVHPRIDETVVLTYDETWTTMIERQASEFVDRLNAIVGGDDYEPYAYPNLVGDTLTEPDEPPEATQDDGDSETDVPEELRGLADEERTSSPRKQLDVSTEKANLLAEAMMTASRSEYREETGRYERETRRYRIETQDGREIEATNHNRFLRKRQTDGGEAEYHWVGPDILSPGDEFVTIPDEIETELWRSRLQELYSDELDAEAATTALETWYSALRDIWNQTVSILEDDGVVDPSNRRITRAIHQELTETVPEFGREVVTVENWFESVLEADRPLELAERPELIIGPRDYRDIEAIGRTFDREELVRGAEDIESAMQGLRNINQREGVLYRESIRDRMNSGDDEISEAATYHTVGEIEDVTD